MEEPFLVSRIDIGRQSFYIEYWIMDGKYSSYVYEEVFYQVQEQTHAKLAMKQQNHGFTNIMELVTVSHLTCYANATVE